MVDPSFTFTNEVSNDIENEERGLPEEVILAIDALFDEDSKSERGSTSSSNSNDENHSYSTESLPLIGSGIAPLVGAILATCALVSSHS